MGEYNIMFLRNATGTTGSVGFPANTVLVVKETPWLK
jgi:hypothetical protein